MEKPKLTGVHINSYALAQGTLTMAFTIPTMYLTMFMTDYLGISAVALGTGMLIAKTIDFLVSIVAGAIIEKTNFKGGKYMPWIKLLTITLFFGNIVQMLDTSAFIPSPTVRLVIVCVFYAMFHCSMNFNATARGALIPKMAGANMEDRKRLTSRQAQVGAATSIIASAITLPCITWVEQITGSASMGYFLVALAFSLLFVVTNLVFVKSASAFDPPITAATRRSNVTVKDMAASVVTNKQMLILFLSFTLFTIGTQIYAGVTAYYFRVTGNFAFMTVALTARSIVAFLASLVAPALGRKIGKKMSLVIGWGVYAVSCIGIWLFGLKSDGSANLIVMTVLMCLCQGAMFLYSSFMANYYLDCGEYGYYTTGKDNRTMAITVMNWPTKIGFALGGSLVGYGIAWAGYVAPTATELGYFANMNRYMMVLGLVPAVCMLVGATIMFLFYKLTDEEAAHYALANAEREAKELVD